MNKVICFFVGLTFCVLAQPGILIESSSVVFNNILKGAIPELELHLASTSFPSLLFPIVTNKDLATDMSLSNIKITEIHLSPNETELVFLSSQEIQFLIPDLSISLQLDWKIQSHKKKGVLQSGIALIKIPSGSINIIVSSPNEFSGKFELVKSQIVIGELDIEFDESFMSGVFNWVIKTMNQKLRILLENQLNLGLNEFISMFLQKTPNMGQRFLVPLNDWLVLDSTLLTVPQINNSNIKLAVKGEFYNKNNMNNKEIHKPVIMNYEINNDLITCISQFSLNTLSISYFEYKPIVFNNNDLGSSISNELLEALFPGILDKFGKDLEASLKCKQDKYALFELDNESVENTLDFNCELYSSTPILSLGIQIVSVTKLFLSNNVLHGSFSSLKISKITLQESNLPNPPDIENLQNFLNSILKLSKSLISNKIFGSGIQVPENITVLIKDLKIDFYKGFFTIQGSPVNI